MSKIPELLKWMCCVVVIGVFILIALPVMFVVQPFIWGRYKLENHRYTKFLEQLDGKHFFCYNYTHADFIERELLPKLPNSVEVVFANGSILQSKYQERLISRVLYNLDYHSSFPHLVNISDGRVRNQSLRYELCDTIKKNKPVELFLLEVYRFLDHQD